MVQEQLIEYISSQLKLNVSHDAIKTALTGAGWNAQDVEDTFKKLVPSGAASAASSPMSASNPSPASSSFSSSPSSSSHLSSLPSFGTASSAVGGGATGTSHSVSGSAPASMSGKPSVSIAPQVLKMSDLVSSGSAAAARNTTSTTKPTGKPDSFASFTAASSSMSSGMAASTAKPSKSKGAFITESIEAVLVVIFAVVAGYLFFNNQSLIGKVSALTAASADTGSTASSLTAQVQALTASSTALGDQVTTLSAQNEELLTELAFYAVPPGGATSAASITLSGSLSGGGRAPYALTTEHGAKIFVSNKTEAKVLADLKPLVGEQVQISGTSVPGSDSIVVTSASAAIAAVTNASTTTATSTASTTATTTPAENSATSSTSSTLSVTP